MLHIYLLCFSFLIIIKYSSHFLFPSFSPYFFRRISQYSEFFSVIVSSNKPELWDSLCKTIFKENKIGTEIIFVGPKPPKHKLYKNCVYIKTSVKPSQCWEIASREAKGQYLLYSTDDIRLSKYFLTNSYRHIVKDNDNKIVYSCMFKKKKRSLLKGFNLVKNNKKTPLLGFISLFNSKIWKELGGLDSRFVALYSELDMTLRFHEIGGKTVFMKDCIATEIMFYPNHLTRMCSIDKRTLYSFWMKKKEFSNKRVFELLSFNNKKILKQSQNRKKIGDRKWI